jgi:hypothetical protein
LSRKAATSRSRSGFADDVSRACCRSSVVLCCTLVVAGGVRALAVKMILRACCVSLVPTAWFSLAGLAARYTHPNRGVFLPATFA